MLATYIPTTRNKLDPTENALQEKAFIADPKPFVEFNLENDSDSSRLANKFWNQAKKDISSKENSRTLIELGDANMLRGAFARALKNYQKAIHLNRHILYAYPKIITCALKQSNPLSREHIDLANKYYLDLVELTNRRPEFLHGYVLFRLFFYINREDIVKQAIKDTELIIQENPKNFEAVNTYGYICLNIKNDLKTAAKYFAKSYAINNSYKNAVDNLGVCYFKQNDYENAEKYYNMALDLDPLFNSPYQNLASLNIAKGDFPEAIKVLLQAIDRNVAIEPLWKDKVGQIYFLQKNYLDAIKWFTERLKENWNNYAVLNDLGTSYSRIGNLDKALEYYYSAIKVFNEIPSQRTSLHAFYNLGKIGMMKGDARILQQASNYIQSLNGKDWFSCYLAGAAAFRRSEFERSKDHYRESYKLNKDRPEVYPDLSFIIMDIDKDYDGAIKLLLEGLSKFKDDLLIQNNLAYAYIKSGNLKEAKKLLKKHFDKPQLPLTATVGLFLIRTGNLKKGNSFYDQAIKEIGDSDDVKKTIASQIKEYENALYWFTKNDKKKSEEHIKQAKSFGSTYMTSEVKALEAEIEKMQ